MSEALFVLSVGAFAGVMYCVGHNTLLWWYRRKARLRFERMASRLNRTRPWWIDSEGDR